MAKKDEGFLASTRRERKKIQWPTRKVTLEYSLLVIVISAITGILIYLLDQLFAFLLGFIL